MRDPRKISEIIPGLRGLLTAKLRKSLEEASPEEVLKVLREIYGEPGASFVFELIKPYIN